MKRKFIAATIAVFAASLVLSACTRVTPKVGVRTDDRAANLDSYWSRQLALEKSESGDVAKIIEAAGAHEGSSVAVAYSGAALCLVVPLAKAVGDKGVVYVSEPDEALIEKLKQRVAEEGLNNVKFILSKPADPQLPYGTADVVFVVNAQQYIDLPYAFFDNVRRGMKTGGRLAVVDWDSTVPDGPPRKLRRPKKGIVTILEGMGFTLSSEESFLKNRYLLIFKVLERYGEARRLRNI